MTYICELKESMAQSTLAIRTRASVQDLPLVLGQIYSRLVQYLTQNGEHPAGPPYVAYFNMDMQALDIEGGIPVARPLPGQGDIQPNTLPAGRVATCRYVGPYDDIGSAYEALQTWMRAQSLTPTGIAYEHYLNDPAQVPPDQWVTQIVFPLQPVLMPV